MTLEAPQSLQPHILPRQEVKRMWAKGQVIFVAVLKAFEQLGLQDVA